MKINVENINQLNIFFRLHDSLMKLQQSELEGLKVWLTSTEDRIANLNQVNF